MDKGTPTKWPNVSKLSTGEFLVRVRPLDPRTGKRLDVARKLPAGTTEDALLEMRRSLLEASDPTGPAANRVRFMSFAEQTIDDRVALGKIVSPETKSKCRTTLDHHLIPRWGDTFIDAISRADVVKWMVGLGKLVQAGKYTPETVNTWWRQFKMIMRRAAVNFDIKDPTLLIEGIPTSLHRTYTVEEPNSLLPIELPAFFDAAWNHEREHFAMLALGMLTGRRACELRPLRRQGRYADLNWDTGVLQIRRSQTIGEAMEVTKTKKDIVVFLPAELVDILRTHVANLSPYRQGSDLLFPPRHPRKENTAGYMSKSALDKPLKTICEKAKITKHLTAKGAMRRTYQDLCRAAAVSDLVQRSMSGHATAGMVERYSTVAETEGRQALMRMSDIAGLKQAARVT